jgi:hypothetical protein
VAELCAGTYQSALGAIGSRCLSRFVLSHISSPDEFRLPPPAPRPHRGGPSTALVA